MSNIITPNESFSQDFWISKNIDLSNALMIVDMQELFINSFFRNSIKQKHRYLLKCLIENIANKIKKALDNNQLIIIVEYDFYWDTIPEINKLIKQNKDKVINLQKNSDWLMCMKNFDKNLNRTSVVMYALKSNKTNIEITWINTGACVLRTAQWLNKTWIWTEIPLWTTLNLYQPRKFAKHNKLKSNKKLYSDSKISLDNLELNENYNLKLLQFIKYGHLGKDHKFLYDYVELMHDLK